MTGSWRIEFAPPGVASARVRVGHIDLVPPSAVGEEIVHWIGPATDGCRVADGTVPNDRITERFNELDFF